jgi:carboxyl-terminal processing protease
MENIRNKAFIYLSLILTPFLLSLDDPDQRYFDIAKNMEIFSSVYSEINRSYVDDVNPNQLMKVGIDAMLKSLDPYTNYYPQEDIEDFQLIHTGEYGGIGSMVGNRDGKLVILMPYLGFPAQVAGLKIGDEIISVDGINVQGKSVNDLSSFLKGEAGSKVELTIKRFNEFNPLTFVITRAKVTIENVPYYGMVTEDIGYFKLTTFTAKAAENVLTAVNNLKSKGAKKIIFDLRGNGGGLLDEAIKICNIFISKNLEVVSTRGKLKEWNKTYYTSRTPSHEKLPIAILVDDHSASASEIVSGVLQDYDRAVVIGQKTYGKGLVQGTMKTEHGSHIKVTVAKYYIPSGRCIQALDYSQKDKFGKPIKMPDSLLTAFKTASGRKVMDGNGIYPDIEVKADSVPAVLRALIAKNLLFDFATEYCAKNDNIKDPKKFDFINEYKKFEDWMSTKKFTFEVKSDVALKEFREQLKSEGIDDNLQAALNTLSADLAKAKSDDIVEYKAIISEEIEKEICTRFFLENGMIEAGFDDDKDLMKAIEVLNNPVQYAKILGGN